MIRHWETSLFALIALAALLVALARGTATWEHVAMVLPLIGAALRSADGNKAGTENGAEK